MTENRSDARRDMGWRTNPFHRHAHTRHFLLRDAGDGVGRVAATVHPAHNDRHGRRDVFFGFLDAPVDPRYLAPLLDACADFGREHGATTLAGPWSGAEFGLLTNELDGPTALFQPWNPPGMREALEQLGLSERTHTDAFEIDLPGAIPKTSSGKIQRRACAERYARGEVAPAAQPVPALAGAR